MDDNDALNPHELPFYVISYEYIDCLTCSGTGWVSLYGTFGDADVSALCWQCNGTGRVPEQISVSLGLSTQDRHHGEIVISD